MCRESIRHRQAGLAEASCGGKLTQGLSGGEKNSRYLEGIWLLEIGEPLMAAGVALIFYQSFVKMLFLPLDCLKLIKLSAGT